MLEEMKDNWPDGHNNALHEWSVCPFHERQDRKYLMLQQMQIRSNSRYAVLRSSKRERIKNLIDCGEALQRCFRVNKEPIAQSAVLPVDVCESSIIWSHIGKLWAYC